MRARFSNSYWIFYQTRAVPKAMTNFEIWEKLGKKIEKNPFGIMS